MHYSQCRDAPPFRIDGTLADGTTDVGDTAMDPCAAVDVLHPNRPVVAAAAIADAAIITSVAARVVTVAEAIIVATADARPRPSKMGLKRTMSSPEQDK